jgi:atrophin-1 interacting protein 3 (BAI1-associated protein 1)
MNQFKQKNIFFTRNPNDLKGDFLKTTLLKTHQGFGFTIIGANETSEDFLQIKHLVPHGAADVDNILRQGDILVYVNNECVLGYTHQDVVEMFQSIPIGEYVELTVCRGYPLSIDFNDPNIEIKSLPAINKDGHDQNDYSNPQQQQLDGHNNNNEAVNQINEDDYIDIYVSIVKGPMGFGFTIADDAVNSQQKVKQILDRERCVHLLENDILCEINGIQLSNLTHNQIVEVLKECPKGKDTFLKLKRSKINHLVINNGQNRGNIKQNDGMDKGKLFFF